MNYSSVALSRDALCREAFVVLTLSVLRAGPAVYRPFFSREVRLVHDRCLPRTIRRARPRYQAETGDTLLPEAAATELEFIRAEGCDEGFSGEVRNFFQGDCFAFTTCFFFSSWVVHILIVT